MTGPKDTLGSSRRIIISQYSTFEFPLSLCVCRRVSFQNRLRLLETPVRDRNSYCEDGPCRTGQEPAVKS